MPARLTHLEAMLEASAVENASLRHTLEDKKETIDLLQLKMNSIEQYNPYWSIRINWLAMTSDGNLVKKKVYDHLLLPILQGAVEQGDLTDVPPVKKSPGGHPRAARSRRQDQTGYRKILYPGHPQPGLQAQEGLCAQGSRRLGRQPGRYVYPFFEDLTKMNFTKMRDIAAHPTVAACWSSRGQLRYKLKDSQTVKKVGCVMDTVDQILS